LTAILLRVEAMDDTKRAMRLFGMGISQWSKKVYEIAHCGSPRVEVIAAKLWGLATGVFDDPHTGSGAKVIIEAATEAPDGSRSGVRLTLDSTDTSPQPAGSELIFTAAKPKAVQHRQKMLKKLDS